MKSNSRLNIVLIALAFVVGSSTVHAAEVSAVSCKPVGALGSIADVPGEFQDALYEKLPGSFDLKRVGEANGQTLYSMSDKDYGVRDTYYTLDNQDGVLRFHSEGAYMETDKNRTIVLDRKGSAKSYSQTPYMNVPPWGVEYACSVNY